MTIYGKSDPFAVVFCGELKKEKTKIIKETLNPKWDDLNWVLEISSFDQFRIEIYDWDMIGSNTFEGMIYFERLSHLIPFPIDRFSVTLALRAQDETDEKKRKKVRVKKLSKKINSDGYGRSSYRQVSSL